MHSLGSRVWRPVPRQLQCCHLCVGVIECVQRETNKPAILTCRKLLIFTRYCAFHVASWERKKGIRPHEKICLVSRPTPSKWGRVHFFFEFFCTRHQCERAHVVPTSSYVMEEQKVGRSASVIVVFRFLFHQTFSTC